MPEALFYFPALRFNVFSPYRESRYCGAPKPGEEKQKSYDYRSAILMVHRFRSLFVRSPRYCVRGGVRLRGKWLPSLKHDAFAKVRGLRYHRISDSHPHERVHDSAQPDLH